MPAIFALPDVVNELKLELPVTVRVPAILLFPEFVIDDAASEVNAPVFGVVEPIAPGCAQSIAPAGRLVRPDPSPVILPAGSTLNTLDPATCRSSNLEDAFEAEFVILAKIPVNAVAPEFQV